MSRKKSKKYKPAKMAAGVQFFGGGGGNRTHVLTRAMIGLPVEHQSPPKKNPGRDIGN